MKQQTPKPRGTRIRLAAVLAAAALTLAACSGGSNTDANNVYSYQSPDGSTVVWQPLARTGPVEIAGTTYDGEDVTLTELQGDVVVLNTWYASCAPCRAEAPDLVATAEEYQPQGVHFYGINSHDSADTAAAFDRTFGIPYQTFDDHDAQVVAKLQGVVPVQAVPTTVVLDRSGLVAARILGRIDAGTLRGILDQVLEEDASEA